MPGAGRSSGLTKGQVMKITVNGRAQDVAVEPDTPLLWVLRDELGLTGTKYGCGIGACGACTVIIDGEPTKSCSIAIEDVAGSITTIEALADDGKLTMVQQAWIKHQVAQCGYCQSGQIMAATALLKSNPSPTDQEINEAMSGNLCRCGTYQRVRAAIRTATKRSAEG